MKAYRESHPHPSLRGESGTVWIMMPKVRSEDLVRAIRLKDRGGGRSDLKGRNSTYKAIENIVNLRTESQSYAMSKIIHIYVIKFSNHYCKVAIISNLNFINEQP